MAESGWVVFVTGGVFLGLALIALMLAPGALPAWLRWSSLVAGIWFLSSATPSEPSA